MSTSTYTQLLSSGSWVDGDGDVSSEKRGSGLPVTSHLSAVIGFGGFVTVAKTETLKRH